MSNVPAGHATPVLWVPLLKLSNASPRVGYTPSKTLAGIAYTFTGKSRTISIAPMVGTLFAALSGRELLK